jgi:hypothetical protein
MESEFLQKLIILLDRGSKFIPCINFTEFDIFKFILEKFEDNFNAFNSRLNIFFKNFSKTKSDSLDNTNSTSLFKLFMDKRKIIINNFKNVNLPLSKDSIDFKFGFYRSICDLNLTKNFNITKSEFFFLKKFKKEKPFKVIDCDKNVGLCFIDTNIYNKFVEEHLNNRDTYDIIQDDPLEVTLKIISDKLDLLCNRKHISKKLSFKLKNNKSKLGVIRLLAKLHKNTLGFRPIINCLSHPTLYLCLLVDIILQDFVKKTKSFILDSQNLIQKTLNTNFGKNCTLYSCDFESLYTNICLTHALQVISEFISRNFKSNDITSTGFHEILKLIFENNVFSFNNKFYRQKKGIAMGAKCAPAIANLYLAIMEDNFLVIHKPLFYCRFIDDIFVILDKNFNIEILINSFGNLKLNIMSNKSVNFLDLVISLDPNTNFLHFSLYTKPTNTFSYLLYNSNHPNFIFKNIPKSIFIRIRRICTSFTDYLFFSSKICDQLINRGYNRLAVEKTARLVAKLDRIKLLPYKKKDTLFNKNNENLIFSFPYEKNANAIKTAFNSAFNSISNKEYLSEKKFTFINSMQQNLSSLFVHEHKLLNTIYFRYEKCKQKNCNLCFFSNNRPFILINKKFYLPVMNNSNCSSKNVIYILTCNLCDSYYVGHSISAKGRLKSHITAIRKNKTGSNCVCVHKHFNLPKHDALKYFTFNIFRVNIDNKFKRLAMESQLINLLVHLGANLINDFIPDLYYWYLNFKLFGN